MHMRLLTVDVEKEGVHLLRRLYEEKVVPSLERMKGCRFAGLMQSVTQQERCLSLTLWDSPGDAAEYEQSGLYGQLLEESKIFLSQSIEYTLRLSEDMRVEYVPVSNEPVAHSYQIAAQSEPEKQGRDLSHAVWLRLVSLEILPGKFGEFKQLYVRHSIPALRAAPGCRHAYLLENDENGDKVFSITVWDSREHAVAYEKSGVFERLIGLQKHTLSGHAREKLLAGEGDVARSRGTGDVLVEHYTMLTGRSFN